MNILVNALRTPDGTLLESRSRHDYVTYQDANGKHYMVDGGIDYIRRSANGDEADMSIQSEDPHSLIRERFTWGTYGINGDQPIKYVKLKNLDTSHIEAIIETQGHLRDCVKQVFKDELEYRGSRQ